MKKFLKKGGIQSGKEGTALILSLLILSIMVVASLAASHSSVISKKTALTSTKSGGAIQQSDSSAEKFISEYNGENSTDVLSAANLADCNTSSHRIESGGNEIIMYEADGTTEIPCDDSTKKIKDIAKIKSIGADGGAKRAIEITPPCGGVEFPTGAGAVSDTTLIGYWPLDTANQLDDLISNNDAANEVKGSAPNPSLVGSYKDGKDAIVFNVGFTPLNKNNYNYAEIANKDAYKKPEGTISFWFYSENASNESWVPFSKDANSCDERGNVRSSGGNNYVDLDNDGVKDSGEPWSYCGGGPKWNSDDSNCDCGHLSFYYNNNSNRIFNPPNPVDRFWLRYQNDGNGSHYRLVKDDAADLRSAWHIVTLAYNNSAYKLHMDGQLKGSFNGSVNMWNSFADADGLEGQISNGFDINLGRSNGSINDVDDMWKTVFKGGIRELRIYNRALEACEVKRLYEMTL